MNEQQRRLPAGREAVIEVYVDVHRVKDLPGSSGNTSSGHYLFRLSQDVVHVDAVGVPTLIRYCLTRDTVARGITFTGAYTTDFKFQLRGPYLSQSDGVDGAGKAFDTVSFEHSNTHSCLISVSLQVSDSQAPEKRVAYDPQITNTPGD